MGFLALMSAWRTINRARLSDPKPAKAFLVIQVGLQVVLGLVAILLGLYFAFVGE
jgi:heme A synthase